MKKHNTFMILIILASVVLLAASALILSINTKTDAEILTKAVNDLLNVDFFCEKDVISLEKTHQYKYGFLSYNYGFAIEVKIDDEKLSKLLNSHTNVDIRNKETKISIVNEGVPASSFSKELTLADEKYYFLYPLYHNIEYPRWTINRTKGHRRTMAILSVFKEAKDSNYVCIQIHC